MAKRRGALLLLTACLGVQANLKAGERKAQLYLLCHKPSNVGLCCGARQPQNYLVASINA